jgi:hypothetical protein
VELHTRAETQYAHPVKELIHRVENTKGIEETRPWIELEGPKDHNVQRG